jgi:hypothetical protein
MFQEFVIDDQRGLRLAMHLHARTQYLGDLKGSAETSADVGRYEQQLECGI